MDGGDELFLSKREMLSRIETLESMVVKLIAQKDAFEDTCRVCERHNTAYIDGKLIEYCNLYASEHCKHFKGIEGFPKSCEAKPTVD